MTELSPEGAEAPVCSAGQVWLNLWGCTANTGESAASLRGICCDVTGLDHWISILTV